MRPGEVYYADFGPVAGVRPVIVLSRESLNRGTTVMVVPCTTQRFAARSAMPSCVPFRAGEFGMTENCVAQAEALQAILRDALDADGGPLGTLDDLTLRDLVKAVGYAIESDCEPS